MKKSSNDSENLLLPYIKNSDESETTKITIGTRLFCFIAIFDFSELIKHNVNDCKAQIIQITTMCVLTRLIILQTAMLTIKRSFW